MNTLVLVSFGRSFCIEKIVITRVGDGFVWRYLSLLKKIYLISNKKYFSSLGSIHSYLKKPVFNSFKTASWSNIIDQNDTMSQLIVSFGCSSVLFLSGSIPYLNPYLSSSYCKIIWVKIQAYSRNQLIVKPIFFKPKN